MIGITLEQVIDDAISSRLANVWTALPATVTSWSPSGTVSVQPFPAVDLDGVAQAMPSLSSVPVAYPSGAGGSLTYPLRAGDTVILIFSSSPLATYRETGSTGDPVDVRRFDLSDAWCIPVAGGARPTAQTDRAILAQPDDTGSKVQVGVTPAVAPVVVPVPLVPGPVLAPGTMQPPGRAARTGDAVTVTLDAAAVAELVAAMAVIAGGGVPPDIHAPGVIVSGSDVVEVK